MSDQQNPMTKKDVVYRIPGMDEALIHRDVEYMSSDDGAYTMDIYRPGDAREGEKLPAVIFVTGYPDPGFQKFFGCRQKEMASYASWGRLAAASGLVGVTYSNVRPEPDAHAVFEYLRSNAEATGIDENRIGLWACSGNVPLALSLLMTDSGDHLKFAVLCYGYMLDSAVCSAVADAAGQWGFVNPGAGKSVADLSPDVPLMIIRAGKDECPGLNDSVDNFLVAALAANLPVTLVNHPDGPHAFDLWHDSEMTRVIIRQALDFMQFHATS